MGAGQGWPAAAQVWGLGREESSNGRWLHRHIPEGPRRQEGDRPRATAGRHPAGLQEQRRRCVQARLQSWQRQLPLHAAQKRQGMY